MYSQNNIESLFKLIGNIKSNIYTDSENYSFIKSENSIWPNLIFNLNYNNYTYVIKELEIKKKDLNFPSLIMLNPNIKNIEFINYFNNKYKSAYWSAMTHNLLNLVKLDLINLDIIEVQSFDNLLLWINIVEKELMGNIKLDINIFNELLTNKDVKILLGFTNKVAVSTSLIYTKEGESGIYLVSTLSNHRNKGFGFAMTNYCLFLSKNLNSKLVHIQATKAGYNTYLKAGFKDNGKINVYNLRDFK